MFLKAAHELIRYITISSNNQNKHTSRGKFEMQLLRM